MATRELNPAGLQPPSGETLMSFEEAIDVLSRDDRFQATVYAMNTLLVQKGVYSPDEFEFHFRQWAQKEIRKPTKR